MCAFLFDLAVKLDTASETPFEFWIYASLIGLCVIIRIVVTIIWYLVIEKSNAMNALWNDRMRIIENKLKVMQIQNMQFKIFTIKRKKFIKQLEKDEKLDNNNSAEPDITNGHTDEKSDIIEFIERLRIGQRSSIGAVIKHIIFTFFFLWIAIAILLAIIISFTLDKNLTENYVLFFYLIIPLGLALVYSIISIVEFIKKRCKIRKQFIKKNNL